VTRLPKRGAPRGKPAAGTSLGVGQKLKQEHGANWVAWLRLPSRLDTGAVEAAVRPPLFADGGPFKHTGNAGPVIAGQDAEDETRRVNRGTSEA
jgi:hypothetical protein